MALKRISAKFGKSLAISGMDLHAVGLEIHTFRIADEGGGAAGW
jgi:hypothetical protein